MDRNAEVAHPVKKTSFQRHLRLVPDTSGFIPMSTFPASRFTLLYPRDALVEMLDTLRVHQMN